MPSLLIGVGAPRIREQLARFAQEVAGRGSVTVMATGNTVIATYNTKKHDLVLLDAGISDPSAVMTIKTLVSAHPDIAIVVLGLSHSPNFVSEALNAGARGFLRGDLAREDVALVLAHALTTPNTYSSKNTAIQSTKVKEFMLTEREMQVLNGMCEGKSNGEIGRSLYLSEDTVKTHARRLFRKLGVNDRAHAVATALRNGIVS